MFQITVGNLHSLCTNKNRTVENKVSRTTKPNLVDYFQLKHAKRLAVQDKHANFEEILTRSEDYIANSAVHPFLRTTIFISLQKR